MQDIGFSPGIFLYCNVSQNKKARPLVPQQHRVTIINVFHQLQHPGVKGTIRKVSERYYWPLMKKQITDYVHSCKGCLGAKDKKIIRPDLKPMPVLAPRLHDISLDIVGPLTPSNNFRYLLTIVDRTSRYFAAVPMVSATSSKACRAFLEGWASTSAFRLPAGRTTASRSK